MKASIIKLANDSIYRVGTGLSLSKGLPAYMRSFYLPTIIKCVMIAGAVWK
jgi:hypothetical protein